MNRDLRTLNFKLRALLCVLLVMNLSFWTFGCGQTVMELPDGSIRIALTPGHPLTSHLKGSAFDGATAVEINPASQEFRFIFPDEKQQLAGKYVDLNGRPEISEFTMANASQSITLELNTSKCITSITTSTGHRWERPAEWGTPVVASDGIQAYLAANRELMEMAEDLDRQMAASSDGSSTGGAVGGPADQAAASPGKTGQAALGPALVLLAAFGAAGVYGVMIVGAIGWVLQLIALITLVF